MQKRPLGNTGMNVSVLGLGTANAAYLGTEQERFGQVLNLLLDAGLNFIDTAASYPGSEEALGKLIGHRRAEYFLVSKCGSKVAGAEGSPWSESLITQTVDRALAEFGTDHLDGMLLHSCDLKTLQKGEAIGALVKAKAAGKIRHIGYSGDNDAAAFAVTMPEVEILETSISVVDQANIRLALPGALKHNVGVIAKRPIGNAAWRPIDHLPGMYKSYAKTYNDRFAAMDLKPQDVGLTDWAELALRFTLSQPGVATAIIGTTNPDNARKNAEFVAKGPLDPAAVAKIQDAFKKADADGKWAGQT
ncbi:aldo/keto reductase [soil metagenome]